MNHVRLLGPVELELHGELLSKIGSQKSLALLGYLVRQPGAISREQLATLFWIDLPAEEGRRNLRWNLNHVSKLLPGCFEATRHQVRFLPTPTTTLDLVAFETLAAKGDVDALTQAVALYRGDFMAGLTVENCPEFELWLLQEREFWCKRVIHLLQQLMAAHSAAAHYFQAQQVATRLLTLEPWHEETHRQLMRFLAHSGDRNGALRQYESCRQILTQELAVDPMPETTALYKQIRADKLDKVTRWQGGGSTELAEVKVTRDKITSDKVTPSSPHLVTLSPPHPVTDWGEAPEAATFYGRQNELTQIHDWISNARCRVVAVVGMGGMGKTVLAARLARRLTDQFVVVIWRSLLHAPPLTDLLRTLLQFLSNQALTTWPTSAEEQMALLLPYLQQQRCLLVLDNWESLLLEGDRSGYYRPGYEAYGQLLLRLGERSHQSCLLLTSRERPREVTTLESDAGAVRVFALNGLDSHVGRELLGAHGVTASGRSAATLVARYSGNPLALKLVAETIVDFFAGDIDLFLREETLIFDDIRHVLDQHFARLTPLERAIILWLAIEREECTLQTLHSNLWPPPAKRELLEALRSLQQRSLLEKNDNGLALQNVVMEYAIGLLLDQVSEEIKQVAPLLLKSHALFKAQAKGYIRQSQQRLLLQPLGERLLAELGAGALTAKLKAILTTLRSAPSVGQDYGGGNLLNLLLHWGAAAGLPLDGYDFSQLTLRQVDLQGVRLPPLNLAHTQWMAPVFTNTFGNVTTVAFSRDGQYLAAGSSDGAIRFWRVADGQLLMTLVGHERFVWSLAFSPDGKLLASGSADQTVRIWDVERGELRHTFHGHGDAIYAVAFHPAGAILASCGVGDAIRLWDLRQGKGHTLLAHPYTQLDGLAFDPTGRYLAAGGKDRHLLLWELASGQLIRTFTGHEGGLRHLCFSPDGQWLAASCYDHTVRIWQLDRPTVATTLRAHAAEVGAVAYSPDGRWLASGSWDKTVRIWDLQSGQTIQTLYGHNDWITDLAFSPDGALLVSSSWDKSIRLWEMNNLRAGAMSAARQTLIGFVSSIYALAFRSDGAQLASGGEDHLVRLWDMATGKVAHTLVGHKAPVYGLAFHPTQPLLASAGNELTICLWDSQTGQPRQSLEGHTNGIKALAFSPRPAANLLASAGRDQTIRLWDVARGRTVQLLAGHTATVSAVAFHSAGNLLASGSYDHTVRLWDLQHGAPIHTLQGHTSWVYSVAFSPDSRWVASAGYDKTIRLWNVASGALEMTLTGHTDYVYSVAFSPDGATLASSSTDLTVRLWDVREPSGRGALRHTFTGHTNWVWSLAFNPVSGLLASGSVDATIKLWDCAGSLCRETWRPPGPYTGMKIAGIKGVTPAQIAALKGLGALDEQ